MVSLLVILLHYNDCKCNFDASAYLDHHMSSIYIEALIEFLFI